MTVLMCELQFRADYVINLITLERISVTVVVSHVRGANLPHFLLFQGKMLRFTRPVPCRRPRTA